MRIKSQEVPAESLDFSDKIERSVIQLKDVISNGRKKMDPNESKICVFENVSDLYIFVSLSIVCVIFST